MANWILQKIIGTHNERQRKRIWPIVERVNAFEPQITALSDEALRAKTEEFRGRLKAALAPHTFLTPSDPEWYNRNHDERVQLQQERRKIQQAALDAILPEAFAVVREASRRRLNMRHFDVQLMGGVVLHEGRIAEMSTGEGKTLVATLPVYLNALVGRGVHVVTVNDYLARRDARWMGPVYHALGLSIGVIQGVDPGERRLGESLSFIYDPAWTQGSDRFVQLRPCSRSQAYQADITYGQNNEFGFDYLRDNMRFRKEDLTQGEYHFAIVDEVDSILIDEARTPLIISGPAEESTELYYKLDKLVRRLAKETDYEVDEKERGVSLTEDGIKRAEEMLGVGNLYDEGNMRLVHHIQQALRAHELFKRDVEYMIKDDEVIIVDEFTGRLMPGRRWSDGLHQAIEAKEGVRIREENQTLATVTFQNYFRMYEKLAGMTGTATTEAAEFSSIYKLDVISIPTNRKMARINYPDVVFKTEAEKFLAVVQEVVELYRAGQPVLIGTISIEKSELLSKMLKEPGALLRRIGTVAAQALQELQKAPPSLLPADARKRMETELGRPGMMTEAAAGEFRTLAEGAAPKSMLFYRLEELERLVRAASTIRQGLPHNVLNARYHEQEARFVAQAGRKGAVTIATNMAGRGTDILLGGNPQALADDEIREEETRCGAPLTGAERQAVVDKYQAVFDREHVEVVEAGGLHVLGTERHEARRIDNQLRGRSGRQGDPGSSRFYLSFQDDLMRVFAVDWIEKLMNSKLLQWEEGMPLEAGMVTRAIETAQRRVEGHNFDARKQLLEYDNTMNRQREVIYEQRHRILEGVDLRGLVRDIIAEVGEQVAATFAPAELRPDAWDLAGLRDVILRQFGVALDDASLPHDRDALAKQVSQALEQAYEAKTAAVGAALMSHLERTVLLSVMDAKWKDHLYMMDALREGIHLRAYGQRDPVVEYQREAYRMFQDLIGSIKVDSLAMLLRVQPVGEARPTSVFETTPHQELHPQAGSAEAQRFAPPAPEPPPMASEPAEFPPRPGSPRPAAPAPVASGPKTGRNDPCHCGSGKKFKKCHGA